MKKLLLLITLLNIVLLTKAQPIITEANYPNAGETYQGTIQFASPDPGASGPNATWDFSSLSTSAPGPLSYVAPSGTPYASSFPTSNVAINFSVVYLYYNSTSTQLDVTGSVSGSTVMPYKDPQTAITFPFTYLDNLKDTANTDSITVSAKKRIRTTFSETLADGYGTLILPGPTTYNNVLRIRITAETIDSNFTSGSFTSRDVYKDTSYYWFSENYKPHLLWIEKDSSSSSLSFYEYFTDPAAPTGVMSATIKYVKVYPNPAHSEIMVELDKSQLQSGASLSICISDAMGKQEILCKDISSGAEKVSLQGLKEGIYFYRLKKGNDILESGKISVQ